MQARVAEALVHVRLTKIPGVSFRTRAVKSVNPILPAEIKCFKFSNQPQKITTLSALGWPISITPFHKEMIQIRSGASLSCRFTQQGAPVDIYLFSAKDRAPRNIKTLLFLIPATYKRALGHILRKFRQPFSANRGSCAHGSSCSAKFYVSVLSALV